MAVMEMAMSDDRSSSGGLGFMSVLAIVFITLKLCGVIDWAWWLVLAPIWGPVAIVLVFIVGFLVAYFVRMNCM